MTQATCQHPLDLTALVFDSDRNPGMLSVLDSTNGN